MGEAGAAWIAGLPGVIEDLQQRWSITLGRPLPGGSSSYVARVRRADGSSAVLKISVLTDQIDRQVAVLRRADGRGYARLLDHDLDRAALLLEALGPTLAASGRSPEDQLVVLAETLREAWQCYDGPEPTGDDDKAASLHDLISSTWSALEEPCPRAVVDQALRYADGLVAADPAELVVVHGDPHPSNALRAGHPGRAASGYCFVDPDGFPADRAYDLGVALRDWCGRLDAPGARTRLERYCAILAEHSEVDAGRIWRWGFVERVSTGLYVMSFGAERIGRPYLETAAWLLD
jgi:streptomycin 6-kinase